MNRFSTSLVLSLLLASSAVVGCAKEGPSPTAETAANAAAPTYKAGCDGRVEGAERSAPSADAGCKAQDATFHYAMPQMRCLAKPIYKWSGSKCEAIPSSTSEGWGTCSGADCTKLFDSEAACKDAFKSCGG